jgi:hypothetical protein
MQVKKTTEMKQIMQGNIIYQNEVTKTVFEKFTCNLQQLNVQRGQGVLAVHPKDIDMQKTSFLSSY